MEEKGGEGFSPPKKEGKKKEMGGKKERERRNGKMEIKLEPLDLGVLRDSGR